MNRKGAKKIIIDVRSNTGGLVKEALEIADIFCNKDQVLLVTENSKNEKEYVRDEQDSSVKFDEIVVLTEETDEIPSPSFRSEDLVPEQN